MLISILGGIFCLLIIALIVISKQSPAFRVERSTAIAAPASAVFDLVNDFHKWGAWSPWEKIDPDLKRTYDGAPAGVGAIYSWVGNKQVGEGRMTILESRPNELVRIKLEFLKPFKATNTAEFTFKPQGNQTLVNWSMSGEKNFVMKAFCMFANMDKMVGGDFEKGLNQMKAVAESGK